MTSSLVSLVSWIGALTLICAGVAKAVSPATAASFFARTGVPLPRLTVRIAVVVECTVGVGLLVTASRWALGTQATLYAAFTCVLLLYRIRTGERTISCGCFGGPAPLPVKPHIAAVSIAFIASLGAIGLDPRTPGQVMEKLGPGQAVLTALSLLVTLVLLAGALSIAGTRASTRSQQPSGPRLPAVN